MGIDAGFDMYPPLSKGVVDRLNWGRFIDFIKEHYKDDTQVEIMSVNSGELDRHNHGSMATVHVEV
jgi:hypothetical protein